MFAKAQIVPLDNAGNKKSPIECMFNPREYTISRSMNWENQPNDTSEAGNKVYKGGQPATLNLELFFDTYGNRKSAGSVEDVRKYTEKLWGLTQMHPVNQMAGSNPNVKKSLPPQVLFQWGTTWHFAAVIKTMEQQFTLFMPDGTPVRSIIKVALEQADSATHFYGLGGGPRTYHISKGIRQQASKLNNADLRQLPFGRGVLGGFGL